MLESGADAPTFTLSDQSGSEVDLAGYRGRWMLLWWYPEAGSSGCSAQVASLRSARDLLDAASLAVVGISYNSVEQNNAFSCDYDLGFPLLSDPNQVCAEAYGVRREPGEPYADKPHRMSFLIDPGGTVAFAEAVPHDAVHGYADRVLHQLASVRG